MSQKHRIWMRISSENSLTFFRIHDQVCYFAQDSFIDSKDCLIRAFFPCSQREKFFGETDYRVSRWVGDKLAYCCSSYLCKVMVVNYLLQVNVATDYLVLVANVY